MDTSASAYKVFLSFMNVEDILKSWASYLRKEKVIIQFVVFLNIVVFKITLITVEIHSGTFFFFNFIYTF